MFFIGFLRRVLWKRIGMEMVRRRLCWMMIRRRLCWNDVIMRLTAMDDEEALEDVAHTSGIVVPAIRPPEVHCVISKPVWVSIKVLLALVG